MDFSSGKGVVRGRRGQQLGFALPGRGITRNVSRLSAHIFEYNHEYNKKGRKCALAHTARTVRGDIDQRKVES